MTARLFDGRYELLGDPKAGGMSVVYQAREISSGAICAIKISKDSSDQWLRTSFEAEHRALANLNHPNIVKSLNVGVDTDRTLYLALEWVPNTLHDEILTKGKRPWVHYFADFGKPILDALRYAHGRQVAHRDLKPKNILLTSDGTPKIADFGIARNMAKVPVGPTLRGAGSPPYTPPEPDDGIYSFGRDCFSWAVITLSSLAGRIFANLAEVLATLEALDARSSPVEALRRSLSLEPKDRYRSASELAADIESFERTRIHAQGESISVAITFTRSSLERCLTALNTSEIDVARANIFADINEVAAIDILSSDPLTIVLIGASCLLDGEVQKDSPDQILIMRVQTLSFSAAERKRDESAAVPFVRFTDRVLNGEEMRRNLRRTISFVESELARKELEREQARKEKFFNGLAGYLREKERYYRNQADSIHYSQFRREGFNCTAILEKEVEVEALGESLIVELPNARPVIFDVVDVNLDQVVLQYKVGSIDFVPESGYLKVNRTADLMALGKQRAALDAVRSGMAVSAYLGDLLRDLSRAIPPEASGPPVVKDLSQDKLRVLEKALGIVQFLVVEGPPGTGKTTLIAELIAQYLGRFPDRRVLLSSQTHVALDHVLTKLKKRGLDKDIVRIAKSQERKVDPHTADLLLGRKVEEWSRRAEERSRGFIDEYAARMSLDSKELRAGILGNERLRRMARIGQLDTEIQSLEIRQGKVESDRKRRIQEVEELHLDEIVTATSTLADQVRALREERQQHVEADKRVRDLLTRLGASGKDLAESNEIELADKAEGLLPATEDARLLRAVIELQHKWLERLGASQDFYPAVLKEARVVAGTCVGLAGVQAIYDDEYDLCIVDEASKATATETLIPMSRSRTWMLVGDPKQLPPFMDAGVVIQVEGFSDEDINTTLLDYTLKNLPEHSRESLKEQHRMVKGIGDLVSHVFYQDALTSTRKDTDRKPTTKKVFPKPITWISTSKSRALDHRMPNGSYRNSAEADIVAGLIRDLNKANKNASTKLLVAVIASYAAQVKLMKDVLGAIAGGVPFLEVECNTVDAFQGRDADVCIYSVTRSNKEYKLGFQKKKTRLNVALSRARDALVIVGDLGFCKVCPPENPFPPVIEFLEEHPLTCEIVDHGQR